MNRETNNNIKYSKSEKKNLTNEKTNMRKLVFSIFISCLVYICIAQEGYINKYNIVLLPLIFFFSYFVYHCKFEKKYTKICLFFSIIYSILFLFGSLTFEILYSKTESIINILISMHSVAILLGTFPVFYIVLMKLLSLIDNIVIEKKEKRINKLFIKTMICMLLLWLPYFIFYIPGFLTSDSISQIGQIISGNYNNHHPIAHTLVEFVPFKLGMLIFNNATIATSMITITQMIIMSAIFSYLIKFLYERNINKKILMIIFCYYAILPMNVLYSLVLWKDVIFAGIILLLTIELVKMLEYKKITIEKMVRLGTICLLSMLFRHNAFYMMILLAFILIIAFRKQLKYILPTFIIVFSIYYLINIPLFNALNINRSESIEYIAIPLQQLGRISYKDGSISDEEKKELAKVISVENMKKLYDPKFTDCIKFDESFKADYLNKHKLEFLKIYINIISKNKIIAFESYLTSTLGYWYPNIDHWTIMNDFEYNTYGIKRIDILSKDKKDYITKLLVTKSVPLYNFIWSIGLYVWLVIFSIGYCVYKKENKKLIVYVPVFGIWLSLLVAAPTFAEFRYMYSFVTTLPILILLPKMKIKKRN